MAKKNERTNPRALSVFYSILGVILLGTGFLYVANSLSVTGFAVIGDVDRVSSGIIGVWLVAGGIVSLSLARKKKGQAAMEFLMTYGWAILAVIIALGVLAYLGIFSGDTADIASLSPPIHLQAANAIEVTGLGDDTTTLELTNNERASITIAIDDIDIAGTGDYSTVTCEGPKLNPITIASGTTSTATLECGRNVFTAGEKFTGDITATFTKDGSNLAQTSTGAMTATIQ